MGTPSTLLEQYDGENLILSNLTSKMEQVLNQNQVQNHIQFMSQLHILESRWMAPTMQYGLRLLRCISQGKTRGYINEDLP